MGFPPWRGRRRGFRGTPPTALMPSLMQRSACGAVRGSNPAVRGTNPAQGPLMTTKFLEKTFRLSEEAKTCFSRQIYERNGELAAARPLTGPTELFAPCFFVEIHRPEPQLCDELVSASISGDPSAATLIVSWRPELSPVL